MRLMVGHLPLPRVLREALLGDGLMPFARMQGADITGRVLGATICVPPERQGPPLPANIHSWQVLGLRFLSPRFV